LASTLNASTSSGLISSGDTSGVLQLQTANTTALTVDGSQNIGIGTTSPQSKLMSQPTGTFTAAGTTSNAGLHLTSSTTTGGLAGQSIVWSNYGTSGSAVQAYISACTYGSNFMTFSGNGSSEAMRIDSSGNLLVATTSSSYGGNFVVYGNSDGANNPMVVVQGAAGSTSRTSMQFYRVSAAAVVGSISTTNAATAYNTSSDYRLKENIAPMTGALTKVAALKPVTYKWKVDGSDGEGFIAHELAEVCPHAVVGEKDALDKNGNPEYQGIDTSFLVATLTAAIQEQQALIVDLQARLAKAGL
jgi:Chaperone of endosialidase